MTYLRRDAGGLEKTGTASDRTPKVAYFLTPPIVTRGFLNLRASRARAPAPHVSLDVVDQVKVGERRASCPGAFASGLGPSALLDQVEQVFDAAQQSGYQHSGAPSFFRNHDFLGHLDCTVSGNASKDNGVMVTVALPGFGISSKVCSVL